MNGVVFVAVVLIGIGLVGNLTVSPLLEHLGNKGKVREQTVNTVGSSLNGIWGIGMLMMGIHISITTPQRPVDGMFLWVLGGLAIIGTLVGFIIEIVEHRTMRTETN